MIKIRPVLYCFYFLVVFMAIMQSHRTVGDFHRIEIRHLEEKVAMAQASTENFKGLYMSKSIEVLRLQGEIAGIIHNQEVQLVDSITDYIITNYKKIPEPRKIALQIVAAAKKHNLPGTLVAAVIETESEFNKNAISTKGARGLMQVHPPSWGHHVKKPSDLHDIKTGIDVGSFVLRYYLNKEEQDMKRALYRYVGGDSDYYKKVYLNFARLNLSLVK